MWDEVLLKHKVAALVLEACGINIPKKFYLNKPDKGWEG